MNLVHAKITTHCFSHIGQRDENQDRLAVLESPGDESCLFVVADGLGGHAGGSLAAETVVATTERCWRTRYPEQSPEGFLKLLLRECHHAVRRAGREQALDPHSTIAALLLQDGQAISIHAGDSRVMQYSEKAFVDRTLDHSVAQLHAMRGSITDEEIAQHPDQNKLFSQVGGPTVSEPEIKRWDLSEGRRFVLCSDGFWEIFRHDEIVELFASDDPEAEMKRRFETKLKQLKRHDNTTAILAEIPESSVSRRRSRSAHPAVTMAVAALLMVHHAANIAVGQGEGGLDGDPGQGEGAPITATQREVPGVPDSGELETSPIRLQSTDIALDRPVELGEDIVEAVAEELRQRGRLGVGDSLANESGPRELGETTVLRMRQEHRGIQVFAAEVVVSTLEGRIVRIAGDTTPDILLDSTVPANDYPSTIMLAEMLTGLAIAPQDDGTLVVFPTDNGGRLAWSGPALVEQALEQDPEEVAGQNPTQSLEQVYLDVANGEVLLRLPLVHQALDRRIHDFSQACRDAGVRGPMNARRAMARALTLIQASPLVRSEAVGGWHRDAERLFDTLGAYHRFLRLVLDIDSIDDGGKPLVGYIGARFEERIPGIPQCTGDEFMAFWLPSDAMIITDAVLDFPELIGHEATHGLIGNGSGLIYQYESGALHESIADSVGIAFRGWNEDGTRQDMAAEVAMDAANWQIREPSGVIRDLQSPGSVRLPDGTPLPDHYDDYIYSPVDVDNGGVHVNSSIMNHGFYLLAAGGRHTRLRRDPEVEGIGVLKAARIFGAAGAWLLVPTSGFEDARNAFAHVAETIHGEDSMEWVAVHTAMDAIGVPGTWARPPEPEGEPEPPAPVPVSGTAPAPRSSPTPQNSNTPQSPSTPEPPPEPVLPTSDPTAAPPPVQSPAQDPVSAGDESQNRTAAPGQPLVLFLVAAVALAGAAIVMYAYRPGRSSPTSWKSEKFQFHRPNVSSPVPRRIGSLRPEDGTGEISLLRDLLASPEGLVIGRSASICHVELRDPAVSRRHVRLRLVDETTVVEDLNSIAGTRLDGAALNPFKPKPVFSGQALTIAGRTYSIDITSLRL